MFIIDTFIWFSYIFFFCNLACLTDVLYFIQLYQCRSSIFCLPFDKTTLYDWQQMDKFCNFPLGLISRSLISYLLFDFEQLMQIQNLKASSNYPLPPKTANKMVKIKDLLSRALVEMRLLDEDICLKKKLSNSPSKKSDESSESQSINEVLYNLKKGYLMMKHSMKNTEPRNKFIYLSQDNRCLCWKSTQKEDQKRIDLCRIKKVVREGAEYYLKGSRIRDINKCIVIMGEDRILQLEATSQIQAQYLRYELERVIKYSKSMKLNYKYWKKQ